VDYNPYEGTIVEGSPSTVISGGRVVIDNGQFVGKKGAGRFLRRQNGHVSC
jgi:dihydropyrimidinase